MKKIYILPAISLALCMAAAARGPVAALGNPAAVRAALAMNGGLRPAEPAAAETSAEPVTEPAPAAAPTYQRIAATAAAETEIPVSNLADADFSPAELLSMPDEQRGGTVLILHTHGSESYAPSAKYDYKPEEDIRTEDTDFNVVRVGDEIERALTEKGVSVIHDKTLCDQPSYNASYSKSMAIAKKYLNENPDIKIILDVHRDSIEDEDGQAVKVLARNGVAKLMFVVGTDKSGLSHPLWRQNLAFALKLQRSISQSEPELFRAVNLRKNRFNQQLSTGSLILEVGTDANTLDEALAAARIFGQKLGEYLTKA